jgi:hypothetical protein
MLVTQNFKRWRPCKHENYSGTQYSSLFPKFQVWIFVKISEVRCGQYCVTVRIQGAYQRWV